MRMGEEGAKMSAISTYEQTKAARKTREICR